MKFGVHKLLWGDDFREEELETFFMQAESVGADAVELRPTDDMLRGSQEKIREIRNLSEKYHLELLFTFGFPREFNMLSGDSFVRDSAVEYLLKGVRCAAEAGSHEMGSAGLYAVWPAAYDNDRITPQNRRERINRSIECIQKVMPTAERLGIQMNMEIVNRFESYIMNTVDEGLQYCKEVNSPNCSLLLDVFHMNIEEADLGASIRKAGNMVGHFHVSENNRAIPGFGGHVNWEEIGKALRDIHYDKYVTIEAAAIFEPASTYNMRLWRNLIPDTSIKNRLKCLKDSINMLKSKFDPVTEQIK